MLLWQPLLDKMEKELGVSFHKGIPSTDLILSSANPGEHNLICLDDLQQEVVNSSSMKKLFTQLSHHCCISVLFLNQNLFYKGKYARTLTFKQQKYFNIY